MALHRFRRTRSWIEAYGLDVGLALALTVGVVLQEGLGFWIRHSAILTTVLSDILDGTRDHLVGVLPAVTLVFVSRRWLPQRGGISRWLALAALALVASFAGWAFMVTQGPAICGCQAAPMASFAGLAQWHQVLVITGTVAGVHEFVRVSRHVADAFHAEQLERVELDGRLAAGQLQLLLAQIEPHFLFNSLANLRRLLHIDTEAGLTMLADLKQYLEAALPGMRATRSTLGREVELVRAFLAVHRVRMGSRLQVEVDVPATLEARNMPPMMLLTLVENALKHGLNPLPEGGTIRLAASAIGGQLQVSVADTGRGVVPGSGGGMGLENIRGRLRAAYGATASLSLRVNQPRGVVATLVLPELAA
ncbi:MAG: histidine kinase [Pseudomonadota bacterium]|nr:histidine kinase [Pseudomonadota bacterium]